MDRIKSRLALIVATAAMVGMFMVPPAAATDGCSYPKPVCNAGYFVQWCVWYPIHSGQMPGDECDVAG